MPTIEDRFKIRRGTASDLALVNEVPLKGEFVYETDQGLADGKYKLKIGDGATNYNDLAYLQLGGGVETIVPGSHVIVDNTDPKNPIVGVSGLASATSYAEGTAFPVSPAPALNDKFYRTDLNLLCYYDGARWLTVTQYERAPDAADGVNPMDNAFTSTRSTGRWMLNYPNGIYLEQIRAAVLSTTATAFNYWTFQMSSRDAANTAANVGTSFSTSADALTTWINRSQTINSVIASSIFQLQLVATRSGSGPVTYCLPRIVFRRIVV